MIVNTRNKIFSPFDFFTFPLFFTLQVKQNFSLERERSPKRG